MNMKTRDPLPNVNHYPQRTSETISVEEGFHIMRAFLIAYWERGLKQSDDIAVVLGSTQPGNKGWPLDMAQWDDWLDALDKVRDKQESAE